MTTPLACLTRRLRTAGAATALAAALALSGCSSHPGQAAVATYTDSEGVSHTLTISETQLDQVATEFKGARWTRAEYLDAMVNAPALEEVSQTMGVELPEEKVEAAAQEIAPGVRLSQASRDVVRGVLLAELVQVVAETDPQARAELEAADEGLHVTYSPRYATTAWLLPSGERAVPIG